MEMNWLRQAQRAGQSEWFAPGRLQNTSMIAWRNAANNNDLLVGFDASDRFQIQTAAGNIAAAAGASAGDWLVIINGVQYRINLKQ